MKKSKTQAQKFDDLYDDIDDGMEQVLGDNPSPRELMRLAKKFEKLEMFLDKTRETEISAAQDMASEMTELLVDLSEIIARVEDIKDKFMDALLADAPAGSELILD